VEGGEGGGGTLPLVGGSMLYIVDMVLFASVCQVMLYLRRVMHAIGAQYHRMMPCKASSARFRLS